MKVFVEPWSAERAWLALPQEECEAYTRGVSGRLAGLEESGVEVLAWGAVEPETTHQAGHDFYAVHRMRDRDQVAASEQAVEGAGWYDRFEQTLVCGGAKEPPRTVMDRLSRRREVVGWSAWRMRHG